MCVCVRVWHYWLKALKALLYQLSLVISVMSFTSIPVLDLELSRDPATKPGFLDQLRNALMEVGFLYLKNVGISDELWNEVIKEGKGFFDIPREEKYEASVPLILSIKHSGLYAYIHIYVHLGFDSI